MTLFPEQPLDTRQAEALARGLLAVADADGTHQEEVALLSSVYAERKGDPEARTLEQLQALPLLSPAELAEALPLREHRLLFLRAARSLSWSDGVATAREEAALDAFAAALDVGDEEGELRASHPLSGPLPPAVREELPALYTHYLLSRNGTLEGGRLALREAFFAALPPLRAVRPLDLARFLRNHEGPVEDDLDPLLLFLLLVAKVNRVERYGVELAEELGKSERGMADAYIIAEEHYHTRILLSVLGCFGIDIALKPPDPLSRGVIRTMVMLPKSLTFPLVLPTEIAGLLVFKLLLEKAEELLADDPAVRDRVVLLLREIVTDELAHVGFCRGQLGRVGMAAARAALPAVLYSVFGDLPEATRLFEADRLSREISEFDLDALAALCVCRPFWMEEAATA